MCTCDNGLVVKRVKRMTHVVAIIHIGNKTTNMYYNVFYLLGIFVCAFWPVAISLGRIAVRLIIRHACSRHIGPYLLCKARATKDKDNGTRTKRTPI